MTTDPETALVAGGAGFVGSHLCERLLADGFAVLSVDNHATGSPANVAHLVRDRRFATLIHDVREPFEARASRIFDLACPASPAFYQRDPIGTMRTNVLGAINLLELAERNEARILLASTSEVYGDPLVHPQTEDYWGNVNPLGPRACYDEGKRCAETLFMDYRRRRGLDAKIVRIFNTYGPRMQADDGRVVSNFIVQALKGEPITIFGDGSQTRSFCYVDDLVDAMVAMMASDPELSGPVNVGNPDERSMLELAELVLAMTGSSSRIVTMPLPVDDPRRRKPDISLAAARLGWRPKVSLEDGLDRTIGYFRDRLARPETRSA